LQESCVRAFGLTGIKLCHEILGHCIGLTNFLQIKTVASAFFNLAAKLKNAEEITTSRKGTRMGRFYIKRSREPNVKSCAPSRFQVYPGKLESVWILVIVWYPHFLMASCHFSSTVLQNQTLISEIPMIYVCF
jgi:hypothetical protein